jgi:hypothetical protein
MDLQGVTPERSQGFSKHHIPPDFVVKDAAAIEILLK